MLDATFESALNVCGGLAEMTRRIHSSYKERPELVGALLLAESLEVVVADAERLMGASRV